MKPLSSVTVAQLPEFDEIIDVRSPAEFSDDHIPGAKNFPVLDDAERVKVGTIYKQISAFEAKKMGAAIVARNIALHLEKHFTDKPKTWQPLIYCWRGGNRSGAMVHILSQVGWRAGQLDGGYKGYRRVVLDELLSLPTHFQFRVICGLTGSGKSRLLNALEQLGAQVLDLERLAAHRGSVLGNLPGASQPSQKMFESLLWWELKQLDPTRPVFVEAESKKIGNLRVPDTLLTQMWGGQCIRLDVERPLRVELLKQEYAHFVDSPLTLHDKLDFLSGLHGHELILKWKSMTQDDQWDSLVSELLEKHYDPSYSKSMLKHYLHFKSGLTLQVTDTGDAAMVQLAKHFTAT